MNLKGDFLMKSLSKKLIFLFSPMFLVSSLTACHNNTLLKTDGAKKLSNRVTLTWYLRGNYSSTSPIKSHNEIEGLKEIQNRTNININFIDVPGSNDDQDQQLRLMIASDNYPDIIEWQPVAYPGGTAKLLKDGVILKLNDIIEKNAPNLKKYYDSNPDVKKEVETDDGTIAFFPCINPLKTENDRIRQANTGFVMRKDWLDNIGMSIPVSIDDWYSVLKAFKDKDPNKDNKANEIPFDGTGLNMFAPAFGIRTTYYLDSKNDRTIFGPIEPAYKNYLILMNKWYNDGLLGRYTIVSDTKAVDTEINNDIVGTFKGLDNSWTKYLPNIKSKNSNASLVAIPWPKGSSGKAYTDRTEMVTHVAQEEIFITTKCKYPDKAAKLVDFMYTDEGKDLLTWGIKNKSYNIINGENKYLPKLIGQPGLYKYASPSANWPKIDGGEAYLSLSSADQINAGITWSECDTGLLLPSALSFTAEESAKLTELNTDIINYSSSMCFKFITGEEPIANFDTYVETMKKMGVDDAIKIYQDAYNRYKARK